MRQNFFKKYIEFEKKNEYEKWLSCRKLVFHKKIWKILSNSIGFFFLKLHYYSSNFFVD